MKLFLIKSNKDKYKAAQRVLSFKKKTRLTEHAVVKQSQLNNFKLLNNGSVQPPLSARGGGEPPTKSSKKGGLTEPQISQGICWERGGGDFIRGVQFSHKNKSKYENLNI